MTDKPRKVEMKTVSIADDPLRPWWPGDQRVEPFMMDVNAALDRSGLVGQKRTDVYNRAYEAVYSAIKRYDKNGGRPCP